MFKLKNCCRSMERYEELQQAAENYAASMCVYCSAMLYCEDKNKKCVERREREKVFADGAKWAEERLNLSSVWHSADEEPVGKNWIILLEDKNGNHWVTSRYSVSVFYGNWQKFTKDDALTRWAYLSELLPKGGEK